MFYTLPQGIPTQILVLKMRKLAPYLTSDHQELKYTVDMTMYNHWYGANLSPWSFIHDHLHKNNIYTSKTSVDSRELPSTSVAREEGHAKERLFLVRLLRTTPKHATFAGSVIFKRKERRSCRESWKVAWSDRSYGYWRNVTASHCRSVERCWSHHRSRI